RAGLAGIEDPRGDQVQLEGLTVADNRVAGVVAALKADHDVGPLREQVGDLALPLVAPLGADYDDSGHDQVIMRRSASGPAAVASGPGGPKPSRRRRRARWRRRPGRACDGPRRKGASGPRPPRPGGGPTGPSPS